MVVLEPVLGDGNLTYSGGSLSDWSEMYLSCILCPTKAVTHGDLCRECWLLEKRADKILATQWRRLQFFYPGKCEEDPIVLVVMTGRSSKSTGKCGCIYVQHVVIWWVG